MQPAPPMKETVDLRFYVALLWRRKWVVLVPAALAALTSVIVTLPRIMRPVYQSSSTLMIEFPQALSKQLASLLDSPSLDEQMARLQNQMQSNEFLTRMIVSTGLRDDPSVKDWARRNARRYPDLSQEDLIDLKLIDYLRGIVRMSGATRGKGQAQGNMITISVADYYPERARRLVQNITTALIEANRGEQLRQVKSTGDFSATQLEEYDTKLKEAEARLEQFKRDMANRRTQPSAVNENNVNQARDLRQRASSDLQLQESALRDAADTLRAQGFEARTLDRSLALRGVAGVLERARMLEHDYVQQTLTSPGGTGSAVAGQATAIALARAQDEIGLALQDTLQDMAAVPAAILPQATRYLRALVAVELSRTRRNAYDSQVAEFARRLTSLPEADMDQQRLEQEVASLRDLKNTFILQLTSSQISEAYGASAIGEKISVIEPAQHPLKPIRPKRGRIIMLSILAGLALGVVGAFVFEHHDQTFRDVRDAERQLGLRVIGTIPTIEKIRRLNPPGNPRRAPPARSAVGGGPPDPLSAGGGPRSGTGRRRSGTSGGDGATKGGEAAVAALDSNGDLGSVGEDASGERALQQPALNVPQRGGAKVSRGEGLSVAEQTSFVLHSAATERAMREFLNDSPAYQEFRKLALALLRQGNGGPRSLMVTSARRGEGKTTATACLGLALAKELPKERVVLVDLDVRKASLASFFGINGTSSGSVSLRETLWEGEPLRELILPNLSLLPIQVEGESREDQVTSESIRWLLEKLKGRADRLIIDCPPNLPVSDPLIVGSEVDGVLIVIRAGVTPRETAQRGVDLQRQFRDNIVGVIMNNQSQALPYYYSPSHYGYGYGRRG